jgi:hypothetical protein
LSADTLVPEPGNPQSFNRFVYVDNNPLRYWDSTGHSKVGDWLFEKATKVGIRIGNSGSTGKALVVSASKVVNHANEQRQDIFFPDENTSTSDRLGACVEVGFAATFAGTVTYAAGTAVSAAGTAASSVGAWLSEMLGLACLDGDCGNELKSSYEIGRQGQKMVMDFLNDPTAQEEVRVYVGEAGKRANYFARFDILTETAIHEVKNVADLSLSQSFMNQAQTYKLIADSSGLELHYWLVNSAPQRVIDFLQELGVIVHTGVPGG